MTGMRGGSYQAVWKLIGFTKKHTVLTLTVGILPLYYAPIQPVSAYLRDVYSHLNASYRLAGRCGA
jgi:hypothetical protein